MVMTDIKIGDKEYKVKVVTSEEDKTTGLQGIKELPENEGMLFDFSDDPKEVSFWMKDTLIPLDIIFINDEKEVVYVYEGQPLDEKKVSIGEVSYVLEVNSNSGIKKGDELQYDDDGPVMKVLAQDGSTQMPLWGGERIVSRRETKILIKKAKKAELSQKDSDFKSLGRYMFKVIKGQDSRSPEYVDSPS